MVNEWWKFWNGRPRLRRALRELDEVLVLTLVSKVVMPARVTAHQTFSHRVAVFTTSSFAEQALLSSSIHWTWAVKYSSTLETRVSYAASDAFGTLPRPKPSPRLDELGLALEHSRRAVMGSRDLGLTDLYNLVNSPDMQGDTDVDLIRSIHVQIDEAVMEAYGWTDIPLEHGFHTYRQMERWTVSPAARVEILDRLLEENHRRAAIEASQRPKRAKRGKSLEESEKPEGAMF
jgi:hypothetical protein